MKRFWKYIASALALPLLTAACTTDYPEPDAKGLPQASDFEIRIDVDQETNYVTFTLENKGMIPMWIFGEEKIDGAANKKYAYAQNGLQLRFRDAGEHEVEVKAYNGNGISTGSQVVSFTLENTIYDPFDPAPYYKALSNGSELTWKWNVDADKHFGCGQTFDVYIEKNETLEGYGRNWWAASSNEKPQLNDDRLTFTHDGHYTFDPGEDGKVYVNKDSGYKSELAGDEDYLAPMEKFTTTYSFERSWNSAGIEEIYLVLPENTNLSYIPNAAAYANPRYVITTTEMLQTKLGVVIDTPIAGEEGIAWYFEFVPAIKVLTDEMKLAGESAEGKKWMMASELPGHMGCGPNADSPTSWWNADPNAKADFGVYDNVLTFYPDGKYVFDPGADKNIYINWGCQTVPGNHYNPADENDYDIVWNVQESTYELKNGILTLPEGVVIGYIPNDDNYKEPTFIISDLTEETMTLVAATDGIAWQYIFKAVKDDAE